MYGVHHACSFLPEINAPHHLSDPFVLIRQRHTSQRMRAYPVRVSGRLNITFDRQDTDSISFGGRYTSGISINSFRPARHTATRNMNSLNLDMI